MIKKSSSLFAALGLSVACGSSWAQTAAADAGATPAIGAAETRTDSAALTEFKGMFMLDYQVIKVNNGKSIDLTGLRVMTPVNDWLHVGFGVHAPHLKGGYGGFMTVDATAHVQRKIYDNYFANAGVTLGGGGGGNTAVQSAVLSGTGGFFKTYAGVGREFDDFSVGLNVSKFVFRESNINNAQLQLFVQVPFSAKVGTYASSGNSFAASGADGSGAADGSGQTVLTLGADNYFQKDPKGSYKGTLNVADLQFSRYWTKDSYWFLTAGVGYHGRPLYNHVMGGLGYRYQAAPRVNLYGQLGIGSGGYAPDTIDTASGLLIYPKVSAEYMLNRHFGLALSTGYLFAPQGSSRNHTVGAALNYYIDPVAGFGSDSAGSGVFRGHRVNLFHQTEFNVSRRGQKHGPVHLLTVQGDSLVNDNIYIPVQVSVSTNAYYGFPGYGEILAGVGVQSTYGRGDRFQYFGQVLAGANLNGPMVRANVGLNYSLSDKWALYASAGQSFGTNDAKFRATHVGAGLTYRFSLPVR